MTCRNTSIHDVMNMVILMVMSVPWELLATVVLLFLGVKSIVLSGHVCDIRFCDCLPGMLASYTTITLLSALLHQKRFFRWFALNQAVSSFISKSAWSFISWNTASLLFCSQNILILGISHSKQRVCFSSAKLRPVCCLSLSATTDRNLFPVQNCWKQRNSAPKRKNLVLSEIWLESAWSAGNKRKPFSGAKTLKAA